MSSTKAGFYANDNETFYLAPSGRCWIVSSPDADHLVELSYLPDGVTSIDAMLTPDECIAYCRRIQEESGEILLSV